MLTIDQKQKSKVHSQSRRSFGINNFIKTLTIIRDFSQNIFLEGEWVNQRNWLGILLDKLVDLVQNGFQLPKMILYKNDIKQQTNVVLGITHHQGCSSLRGLSSYNHNLKIVTFNIILVITHS